MSTFIKLLTEIIGADRLCMIDVARMELACDLACNPHIDRSEWIRVHGADYMKPAEVPELSAQVAKLITDVENITTDVEELIKLFNRDYEQITRLTIRLEELDRQ